MSKRRKLIIVFGVPTLLVFIAGGVVFGVSHGDPKHTVDYLAQLNQEASEVPEADRAWPAYRKAAMSFSMSLEEAFGTITHSELPLNPEDPDWPAMVEYLRTNSSSIQLVRNAAALSHIGFILSDGNSQEDALAISKIGNRKARASPATENPLLLDVNLPYLGVLRHYAGVLVADARLALIDEQGDRFVDDIHALMGLAAHSAQSPMAISKVVRNAIFAVTINLVRDVLADQPEFLSESQLQAVAEIFARDDHRELMREALDEERINFFDIVQHMYTDNGNGDGVLSSRAALLGIHESISEDVPFYRQVTNANDWINRFKFASRKQTLAKYEEVMSEAILMLDADPWTADAWAFTRQSMNADYSRNPLIGIMLPAYAKLAQSVHQLQLEHGATRFAIEVELFHRRDGRYPQTAREVYPNSAKRPLDLFDGQKLRYRLIDGQPTVYSIGADRDDDLGRPAEGPQYMPMIFLDPERETDSRGDPPPDGDWVLFPSQY